MIKKMRQVRTAWTLVAALAVLLSACTEPLPYAYDPAVVDGLEQANTRLEVVYVRLGTLGSTEDYAVLENDYALILGQLASVRMRAAARPRQHSRFDNLGGGSSLVLAGSTSQLDEAFENVPQNICAPPSEFSTDAEYSLRSMDKAIATIDRMRQCHKEKGLISIRVLVFSEVIRTYMASAMYNEQSLQTQ